MEALLPLLVIIVILAILVAILNAANGRRGKETPPEYAAYERKPALFSPAERSFLNVLELAVGDRYRVFGKVRLLDLVDIRRGLDNSTRTRALNKIDRKHLDFLLCAKDTLEIACAVELDDKSHARKKRQDRDAFLDGLCAAVGLPLARVPAQAGYTVDAVRDAVFHAIRRAVAGAA